MVIPYAALNASRHGLEAQFGFDMRRCAMRSPKAALKKIRLIDVDLFAT